MGAAEEFWSEIDGLATAAATSRAPEALWLADALAALRATIEGRFTTAQDLMDRAAATGRRMQLPNAGATHVSQRIMWHALQGRLADIAPEIDALVDGHPGGRGWQPIRALARACGRPGDAARHFEEAIQLSQHMRSLPLVAWAQAGLADALLSLNPSGDTRDQIAAMLAEAERRGRDLGLLHVTAHVDRLKAQLAAPRKAGLNAFRREGDIWTVCYGGCDLRLKDGKGPRYLATLLAAPGREIHVLELAGASSAAAASAAPEGLSIGGLGGSFDDGPDSRARREYRERLDNLQAELSEAEQFCDQGRTERLRAELDALVSELAQHFGVAAHVHRRGPAEAARKAVTKVLRTQIGKLLDMHPLLGQHLREGVRMGTVCVYAPRTPITWEVVFDPFPTEPR